MAREGLQDAPSLSIMNLAALAPSAMQKGQKNSAASTARYVLCAATIDANASCNDTCLFFAFSLFMLVRCELA